MRADRRAERNPGIAPVKWRHPQPEAHRQGQPDRETPGRQNPAGTNHRRGLPWQSVTLSHRSGEGAIAESFGREEGNGITAAGRRPFLGHPQQQRIFVQSLTRNAQSVFKIPARGEAEARGQPMSQHDRSRQHMAHSRSLRLSRTPRGTEPATWSTPALFFAIPVVFALAARAAEPAMTHDYNAVDAILNRHC